MNLPEYVFVYPASDLPGAGIILRTKEPMFFGRVLKFKREDEYLTDVAQYNGVARSNVKGYTIDIIYGGCLTKVAFDVNTKNLIETVIDEMANYYLREKIQTEPHKFTKFKM
jgi:hypothetical protein